MSSLTTAAHERFYLRDKGLCVLQELIRKDPESYKEEFVEQFHHFVQTAKLIHLQPSQHQMDIQPLLELVTFLASVGFNYIEEAKQFAETMIDLLKQQGSGLDSSIRMSFCKALIALRSRNIVDTVALFELFFELIRCEDKHLRKFVFDSMVGILHKMHKVAGGEAAKWRGKTKSYIFGRLKDSRGVVARTAQLILVDGFRRGYWRDNVTANALADLCFHKVVKLQVTSLKFFLGSQKDEQGLEEDSDDDEEGGKQEDPKSLKEITTAFRHSKKTKKKVKQFEEAKKALTKEKKKKKDSNAKLCNLAAIQLLYDAQQFIDRLYGMLEGKKNEKFEVRMLQMALCARVIGIHKLQTLGYYSYLHRYLQPKQREVTRILLYAAQACHEFVPPDIVEQVVRVIAQNFVSDRNSPEAMTVGLNAIREIYANCPFAATEEMVTDLTEYKTYKNKNVSMAARGLITFFRSVNPKLLHRKDRGKPTNAASLVDKAQLEFGADGATDYVPGAECLSETEPDPADEEDAELDSDDDGWVDMPDYSGDEGAPEADEDDDESDEEDDDEDVDDEEGEDEEEEEDDDEEEEELGSEIELEDGDEEEDEEGDEEEAKSVEKPKSKGKLKSERRAEREKEKKELVEKAKQISEVRILTDADFRKIQAHKIRQQMATEKKGVKRRNDDIKLDDELAEKIAKRETGDGLPRLNDIEHFHKRKKHNKEDRLAAVQEGREGREAFNKPKQKGPHVGRTNRELAKRKNFQMVKQKVRGKNRQRSFKDQQESLRKYLLRQSGRKPR
uniref:Protein SDA1 n=1 Tax=Steinernema glaseri TaxID=37863 RepID=A0A1I7ZEB1_9BILA